ncbi:MAG: class I SAM-dependent methyltransferase [Candidatus Azobacteroides sp.]|nr:class I SAM-dependent methyltransferase [Candidatus Azobacteroides sp.]
MGRSYNGISINTSKNTHEKVFELLDKKDLSQVIVDIPSGGGAFVARLKDAGYKNIYAVDIENILEIEHDHFFVGDMTKTLPFENESCDIVVCIDGIEHISKQFDFIGEVHRILKKRGEVIISTPNISSLRSRFKWLFTGHHHKCNSPLDENNPNPLHHISMISLPEMRYLLHTNGFIIKRITTNRIKPVSWLYTFLLPFVFLSTYYVYFKAGKKYNLSGINKQVLRQMFLKDVLFGETLIVKAVKKG